MCVPKLAPCKERYDKPKHHVLKSRDITLLTKVHIVKAMFFPNSYIQLWELDHKEGWALKNWCFQTVVLKKTLESPLDSNKIKPIKPKGNQSWIFIGRTDAEAETPILWPPDAKSELSRKDLDAGKDWRQEERGITEDETVGWHHWLNGHEFEQTPGDGEGQGNLACWSPWGCKELDTTEWLNWTEPEDSLLNFIPVKMFLKLTKYNHLPFLCLSLLFPHFPLLSPTELVG